MSFDNTGFDEKVGTDAIEMEELDKAAIPRALSAQASPVPLKATEFVVFCITWFCLHLVRF